MKSGRKARAVQEELEKTPLVVVLIYDAGGKPGIYITSKHRKSFDLLTPIRVPAHLLEGPMSEGQTSEGSLEIGVIIGVGNASELSQLVDSYKSSVIAEVSTIGLDEGLADRALDSLTEEMNEAYRSSAYDIPLRVELLLISFMGEIKLVRIKSDGDYHELVGFGVIGGYTTGADGKSLRSRALEVLMNFNQSKKRIPTKAEAIKLGDRILALDTRPAIFTYKTHIGT